jgi:hypothetical protein
VAAAFGVSLAPPLPPGAPADAADAARAAHWAGVDEFLRRARDTEHCFRAPAPAVWDAEQADIALLAQAPSDGGLPAAADPFGAPHFAALPPHCQPAPEAVEDPNSAPPPVEVPYAAPGGAEPPPDPRRRYAQEFAAAAKAYALWRPPPPRFALPPAPPPPERQDSGLSWSQATPTQAQREAEATSLPPPRPSPAAAAAAAAAAAPPPRPPPPPLLPAPPSTAPGSGSILDAPAAPRHDAALEGATPAAPAAPRAAAAARPMEVDEGFFEAQAPGMAPRSAPYTSLAALVREGVLLEGWPVHRRQDGLWLPLLLEPPSLDGLAWRGAAAARARPAGAGAWDDVPAAARVEARAGVAEWVRGEAQGAAPPPSGTRWGDGSRRHVGAGAQDRRAGEVLQRGDAESGRRALAQQARRWGRGGAWGPPPPAHAIAGARGELVRGMLGGGDPALRRTVAGMVMEAVKAVMQQRQPARRR